MKNTLTAIALLISLNGCTGDWNPEKGTIEIYNDYPKVVTIDSCQYIQSQVAHDYYTYTHKGNCSNPIHKTFIHQ